MAILTRRADLQFEEKGVRRTCHDIKLMKKEIRLQIYFNINLDDALQPAAKTGLC